MKTVLEIAVPATLIALMFIVGLDLKPAHVRMVAGRVRLVASATIVQAILLPILAVLFVWSFNIAAEIGGAIVLIAASPGGGISSTYAYLARANTALSVGLTTCSCLAAIVTMPLVLKTTAPLTGGMGGTAVPAGAIVLQLGLFVLLPTGLGVVVSTSYPAFARRYQRRFEWLSFLLIAGLIGLIVVATADRVAGEAIRLAPVAAGITLCAMALACSGAWLLGLDGRDTYTLGVEFGVRNLAIATLMAVSVFEAIDFAMLATIYFLTQAPILVGSAVWMRRKLKAED